MNTLQMRMCSLKYESVINSNPSQQAPQDVSFRPAERGISATALVICVLFGLQMAQAQLARTPPMGWNSWNHFGAKVTDADVRKAADALVRSGLRDRGYRYVNIDDGWQGYRSATGILVPNDRFPDMKALANYVHQRGLLLGLYSSPGATTCAGKPGSAGHEQEDAVMFSSWGIDYLKYDLCSYKQVVADQSGGDPVLSKALLSEAFGRMQKALAGTGRPILYSISEHGLIEGWKWASTIGANAWRTGDDVRDSYLSVTEIGFAQAGLSRFAGPGHWNDPDMLEIGNGGLSKPEAETQMSLWALLAAPLLAGNDLTQMDSDTVAVLGNPEVIAIDQDPVGHQGDRLWSEGPVEVWSRALASGAMAVGIFNRNQGPICVPLNVESLGFHGKVSVHDVWLQKDLEPISGGRTFTIKPHSVILLILRR